MTVFTATFDQFNASLLIKSIKKNIINYYSVLLIGFALKTGNNGRISVSSRSSSGAQPL